MASLADLFSPTFLMFLGILVLIIALMVVYFESKMRDQNHKIASMLSLVSTLAEDMNGVKMGFNQLLVTRMSGSGSEPLENSRNVFSSNNQENKLIEVSDNDSRTEEEDDVYEDDVDDDDSIDDDDSFDDDSIEDDSTHDDIKILKIDINSQDHLSEDNNIELDDMDDLYLDEEQCETQSLKVESKQDLSSEEKSNTELKTIAINLHDESHDSSEYKKLSLPKLRIVVSEKGLATDTSKLKKNELFKLLGVE